MAWFKKDVVVRWLRLSIVCAIFFVDIANLGMANIALPSIQRDLGFDDANLQWVLTAYSLTYGGFLMVGGRAGDIFSQYFVLQMGMALFNAFTLVCALVPNQTAFVVSRALQGLGAAFTIPSAQSYVSLLFEDPQSRAMAFAVWGATGSTGFVWVFILGPIFGGLFSSLASWRWIFWASLIVEGTLQFASTIMLRGSRTAVTKTRDRTSSSLSNLIRRFDPLGTVLSIPGLIMLVYGMTAGNERGWGKADVICTLVLAVLSLCAFIFVELKVSAEPLIPHFLWSDTSKWSGCAIAALTYAVWQGCNYLLTLELQAFGFTALQTALCFLPLGITALIVNALMPWILKRINPNLLYIISWTLTIAGLILLIFIHNKSSFWRFCLPGEILYIAGVGTAYYIGNILVIATADPEHQGSVSGVFNMFLNIGGAVLGVALLTLVSDSVTGNAEDEQRKDIQRLRGYRAGYYAALGMCVLALLLAFVTVSSDKKPLKDDTRSADEHVEMARPKPHDNVAR